MIFDTHRFVKRLTDAGMTPRLAEALTLEAARVYPCDFLVKQDLEQFGTRMVALITWTVGTMMLVSGILVVAAITL